MVFIILQGCFPCSNVLIIRECECTNGTYGSYYDLEYVHKIIKIKRVYSNVSALTKNIVECSYWGTTYRFIQLAILTKLPRYESDELDILLPYFQLQNYLPPIRNPFKSVAMMMMMIEMFCLHWSDCVNHYLRFWVFLCRVWLSFCF